MSESILPKKTREYGNKFFDSTVWNELEFRDGDIVIASYAKAGTTLLQQLVAQLVFGGVEDTPVSAISPWLDAVFPDKATRLRLVESQTHRRFLKTHLPLDALVFSPKARYLYIGRDGRDIALSLYDHQSATSRESQLRLDAATGTPGRLRVVAPPPSSVTDYFEDWLGGNGRPFWPFWEGVRSWWSVRQLPNVLFVHYANLVADMPAQLRRIAAFLDIPLDQNLERQVLLHCSFDHMKANAARYVPQGAGFWKDGGRAFFSHGRPGRWKGVLSAEACRRYGQQAVAELGPDCARWLATAEPV